MTFKGEPLSFGIITFFNKLGGPPARGWIEPDGSFELSSLVKGDGATLGAHDVQVVCFEKQDPALGYKLGVTFLKETVRSLIPRRYNTAATSGLTVEVGSEGLDAATIQLTE